MSAPPCSASPLSLMTFLHPTALLLQDVAGTAADGTTVDDGSGLGWIAWIVIGLLAGWIAEQVMKTDMGLLMNLALGIVGALVGGFLFGLVGLGSGGFIWSLITATIGALLVVWIVNKVRQGRRTTV